MHIYWMLIDGTMGWTNWSSFSILYHVTLRNRLTIHFVCANTAALRSTIHIKVSLFLFVWSIFGSNKASQEGCTHATITKGYASNPKCIYRCTLTPNANWKIVCWATCECACQKCLERPYHLFTKFVRAINLRPKGRGTKASGVSVRKDTCCIETQYWRYCLNT